MELRSEDGEGAGLGGVGGRHSRAPWGRRCWVLILRVLGESVGEAPGEDLSGIGSRFPGVSFRVRVSTDGLAPRLGGS